jgi:hypothetical protein
MEGYCPTKYFPAHGFDIFYVLTHFLFFVKKEIYYLFWFISALLPFLGFLFYLRIVVSDLLLWFGLLNFIHYHYEFIHAGYYALMNFIFLCSFLPDHKVIRFHSERIIWPACRIQWAMIYFFSGLFKLKSEEWISGNTVNNIFHSVWFNPFLINWPNILSGFLDYGIIFFQLSFPVIFLLPLLKKYYVFFGISMHLFIGIFMGLPFFGFFMVWLFFLATDSGPYLKTETNPT